MPKIVAKVMEVKNTIATSSEPQSALLRPHVEEKVKLSTPLKRHESR